MSIESQAKIHQSKETKAKPKSQVDRLSLESLAMASVDCLGFLVLLIAALFSLP